MDFEKYQWIPISDLHVDEDQPREKLDRDHIDGLKLSIMESGFIDEPGYMISVVSLGADAGFIVKAGNHRVTACQELVAEGKFPETADHGQAIPCFIADYHGNASEFHLDQMVSNMVMAHTPYEIITKAQEAIEDGQGIVHVARKLGISPAVLKADLPIGNLPPEIMIVFKAGNLPKAVARKLAEYQANQVLTAWSWAKNGENADKMMAGLKKYDGLVEKNRQKKMETSDSNNRIQTTNVICEWNKKDWTFADAGKYIDRMAKAVANVSNSPIGNGYSDDIPKAVRGNLTKLRTITSQMEKVVKKINDACNKHEAEKAKPEEIQATA